MTPANLTSLIDTTVADLINKDEMFTAFDVTKNVRAANPGATIYHSVVKQWVHDYFENGNFPAVYDRQLIPIGNPEPWLYFMPTKHNPNSYGVVAPPAAVAVAIPLPGPVKKVMIPTPVTKQYVVNATFGGITG